MTQLEQYAASKNIVLGDAIRMVLMRWDVGMLALDNDEKQAAAERILSEQPADHESVAEILREITDREVVITQRGSQTRIRIAYAE